MTRKFIAILMTLVLVTSSVWAGDYEDGVSAYEKKDYVTALKKFKVSASTGNAKAQRYIGVIHDLGLGVAQDYAEAIRWYKLAAAQGNASAQNQLGWMYDKGDGVAQNFVLAHMWSNLSAVNGDADSVKLRDAVAAKMTSQQIAEAQKLARECQARNFKNCD